MKAHEIKEFVKMKLTISGNGYYLFRKMVTADGIEYWDRMGIFPEAEILGLNRRKGYKMWTQMTDDEKSKVNTFPDEANTPNKEWMGQIKRQSRADAQAEMDARLSGKTNVKVSIDGEAIAEAIEKVATKKEKKSRGE